jgi:cytochrome o ubiquinol oxidase operon protein cyoD
MSSHRHTSSGSLTSYVTGFILSVLLTLGAYFAVVTEILPIGPTTLSIVGLGLAQLFVQVIFFLHLGKEEKPYFNLITFCFTLFLVFVVVGGSLWIMHNLEHGMASVSGMEHMMNTKDQPGGF